MSEKPTPIELEIAHVLRQFFFVESNGNYTEAQELIKKIQFVGIKHDDAAKAITLSVQRPGILIGRRGERFSKMEELLLSNFQCRLLIHEAYDWTIMITPFEYDPVDYL